MSKKIRFLTVLFLFISIQFGFTQNNNPNSVDVVIIEHSQQKIVFERNETISIKIPLENVEPFLAYSFMWTSSNTNYTPISIYFEDGNNQLLQELQSVEKDIHNEPTDEKQASELYFVDKNAKFIYLSVPKIEDYTDLKIHFFNPGESREATNTPSDNIELRGCSCPQPPYLTKSQWCPGGCNNSYTPVLTDVTHLIVHHSATANVASDWAAVVRSFWDYHVNGHGWDDIGYNWLIDPNGVIYQGRGDNVRGAHFSGHNTGTMGICVIGTFTTATPTDTAMVKLKKLLAWKSCDKDIDPTGASYHASSTLYLKNIAGHRDSGSGTECPGDILYNKLPQLRMDVNTYLETCESDTIPQDTFPQDTVPNDTIPNPPIDTTISTKKVIIIPNPVANDLHLFYRNNLKNYFLYIEIYDATGNTLFKKRVKKTQIVLQETIPFSGAASGLYFMRLKMGKSEDILKFIKK